tara:strand:+ start:292 stop:936 length:645 start_codon:yes stop_codon:yes gene_type:complete
MCSVGPIKRTIESGATDPSVVRDAVEALSAGDLIVYPTDTLYGLAIDPRQADAVSRLFHAKKRPSDMAIPVIASDLHQVIEKVGKLNQCAYKLAKLFWPGPLTLVIPVLSSFNSDLLGGRGTVAVRVPKHPFPTDLAAAFGYPITATSANVSGQPNPLTASGAHVQLGSAVNFVIDAGPLTGVLPSTIVDVSQEDPVLIREGVLPWDHVLKSIR